jgi:dihydroxyacetone kinase-like protein
MSLNADEFKRILRVIAVRIEAESDYLSELDRKIGDGDHGVTMVIGWTAITKKLDELEDENDLGVILKSIAMSFLNAVGASVGPLYGRAFLRGSMVAKEKTVLNDEEIVQFWSAAVTAIVELGKAEVGDKTMVDTWMPIMKSLESSMEQGIPLNASLDIALEAGEAGMNSTKNLLPQKGRSSRLGERAQGHIDPGAASAFIIFATFVDMYKQLKS